LCSKDPQRKFHAGIILKKVAEIVGGSGGRRPDTALAGGKDAEKIVQALQAVYNIVAGT
jgi:alanyl-tRNA synthetase